MFQSFEIFGREIGMYGLVTVVGIFIACFLIYMLNRKKGISFDELLMASIFSLIGMVVGGHLLFGLSRIPNFIEFLLTRSDELGSVWGLFLLIGETFGGMVFYGGLLGSLFGLFLYCHFNRKSKRLYFNAFAPGFALIHAFGRVGCFLGGCCYGVEYHGPLHVHFPEIAIIGYANADIADFARFPVQLLESGMELLLCIMLVVLFIKFGNKISLMKIYLFSYSILRFFDEFLRGDKIRGFWGPLSTSQWISLFIFIVVSILFIKDKYSSHKKNSSDF